MRNLRKLLCSVLALSLVLALAVFAPASTAQAAAATPKNVSDYSDAADIAAANREFVDLLTAIGVLEGSNGKFSPTVLVKRSEMTKLVAYIKLGPVVAARLESNGAKPVFSDYTAGHWATGYIAYAYSEGIVEGYGNGKFNPDGNVTGTQALKMILAAAGYGAQGEFSDSNWETTVLRYAIGNELFDNYGIDATVDLTKALSRETVARYLANGLTKLFFVKWNATQNKYTPADDNPWSITTGDPVGIPILYDKFQTYPVTSDYAHSNGNATARDIALWGEVLKKVPGNGFDGDLTDDFGVSQRAFVRAGNVITEPTVNGSVVTLGPTTKFDATVNATVNGIFGLTATQNSMSYVWEVATFTATPYTQLAYYDQNGDGLVDLITYKDYYYAEVTTAATLQYGPDYAYATVAIGKTTPGTASAVDGTPASLIADPTLSLKLGDKLWVVPKYASLDKKLVGASVSPFNATVLDYGAADIKTGTVNRVSGTTVTTSVGTLTKGALVWNTAIATGVWAPAPSTSENAFYFAPGSALIAVGDTTTPGTAYDLDYLYVYGYQGWTASGDLHNDSTTGAKASVIFADGKVAPIDIKITVTGGDHYVGYPFVTSDTTIKLEDLAGNHDSYLSANAGWYSYTVKDDKYTLSAVPSGNSYVATDNTLRVDKGLPTAVGGSAATYQLAATTTLSVLTKTGFSSYIGFANFVSNTAYPNVLLLREKTTGAYNKILVANTAGGGGGSAGTITAIQASAWDQVLGGYAAKFITAPGVIEEVLFDVTAQPSTTAGFVAYDDTLDSAPVALAAGTGEILLKDAASGTVTQSGDGWVDILSSSKLYHVVYSDATLKGTGTLSYVDWSVTISAAFPATIPLLNAQGSPTYVSVFGTIDVTGIGANAYDGGIITATLLYFI